MCIIYCFGDRFDVRCLLNVVWCKLFVGFVGIIVVRSWLCVVRCRTLFFVDYCLMLVVGYRLSVVVRCLCFFVVVSYSLIVVRCALHVCWCCSLLFVVVCWLLLVVVRVLFIVRWLLFVG